MTENTFQKKQELFDRWAPNYDCLLTTVFYQSVHKRLLEYVQLTQNPNILDLGCGTGRLLQRLAANFPNLRGTGLDLSPEMLHQARQSNHHHPKLIFIQGNAEFLPFADGQFDAVFNTISFLHYPNPQQVFSEVSRVLNPQGRFYLVDFSLKERINSSYIPQLFWGIHFYSPQQREQLGSNVSLECLDHHYLLGPILLTIFTKV